MADPRKGPSAKQTRLSAQTVGAYGEKAVEAELLRRGWNTANINTSIKYAANFDIFEHKGKRVVNIRVKTSGVGMNAFQFGGFDADRGIASTSIVTADFTVLVNMGASRRDDQVHVVPTRVVREAIRAHRHHISRNCGAITTRGSTSGIGPCI